jgi:single-stranded-DNA-specific exonuclease
MAAGLKLERERLDAFSEAFIQHANARISPSELVGRVTYDCDAGVHELDVTNVDALTRLGPFGRENPEVRLRLRGLRIALRPETFGKLNAHLSLHVEAHGARGREGRPLRLIAWKWGPKAAEFGRGMALEAVVTPVISEWGGSRRVEGHVSDVRVFDA